MGFFSNSRGANSDSRLTFGGLARPQVGVFILLCIHYSKGFKVCQGKNAKYLTFFVLPFGIVLAI